MDEPILSGRDDQLAVGDWVRFSKGAQKFGGVRIHLVTHIDAMAVTLEGHGVWLAPALEKMTTPEVKAHQNRARRDRMTSRYGAVLPQRLRTAEEQLAERTREQQDQFYSSPERLLTQQAQGRIERPAQDLTERALADMGAMDGYTLKRQQAADLKATTLHDQKDIILDILKRGNDVRDWPEDERDLHRGWIGDFTSRHAAVLDLRAKKILKLIEPKE